MFSLMGRLLMLRPPSPLDISRSAVPRLYSSLAWFTFIEDVNMADAISSFLWAEYCYNAALKVGNSILSQTLMDYLN